MPRHQPLDQWVDQVVTAFPKLTRPQAVVLALYSFGVILAQRCGLNSVAAVLVPLLGLQFSTVRSRLQEFYQPAQAKSGDHRRQLEVTTCFAPLLAWILKGWPSTRLAVALDATSMGDIFTVLSISVVYRGSAIPVAWKVLPANVKHAWKPEWIALLKQFSELVEPGWTVIVMTDRGLYARWLYQEIVALGWHPLMRITHKSKFRKAGSRRAIPVTAFVPKVGRHWQGRGMAFPRRANRRLECTLLACWEAGHDQAWFLLTDLDPQWSEGLWYGMRSWIEHGFRLLKSEGWHWERTRMTDPERAERLWLVLAVATRYVLAVGGEAEENEVPMETIPAPAVAATQSPATARPGSPARVANRPRPEAPGTVPEASPQRRGSGTRKREVSVFRKGLAALLALLITTHTLPNPQWKPEAWLEFRGQNQISSEQPPSPIPKTPSL
jgi:DDE family transposase